MDPNLYPMSLVRLLDQLPLTEPGPRQFNLLQPGAQSLWMAHILRQSPVCLLVDSQRQADQYLACLHWLGLKDSEYYPAPTLSPYEWTEHASQPAHARQRIRQTLLLDQAPPRCLLVPIQGLSHLLMDKATWYQSTLHLQLAQEIPPQYLVQYLVRLGYQASDRLRGAGEFARRGGIVDVFPAGGEEPIRIEWLGDEIEQISAFALDYRSQPVPRSQVWLPPAYEWLIPQDLTSLRPALAREKADSSLLEALESFRYEPELRRFMPLMHPVSNLLTSLPDSTLFVWPQNLRSRFEEHQQSLEEAWQQTGSSLRRHLSWTELEAGLAVFRKVELMGHDGQTQGTLLPPLNRNLDTMARSFRQWLDEGYSIAVVTSQPQRMVAILEERDCPVRYGDTLAPDTRLVWVLRGDIPAGFAFSPLRLYCFTDAELFGRQYTLPTRTRKESQDRHRIKQLEQLKEGMLVVHQVHGVGRYEGIVQSAITGSLREYLKVRYAAEDSLMVPVEQMHRLSLYHGIGGGSVRLSKMGGADWERLRKKVKKHLLDLAEELIRTEAERLSTPGFACLEDTEWQKEMELAFPYDETPDQYQAILETKRDMEKPAPMDRLVCGDVGFGKTEIAIRAAFKAIMSGKQVVLLAPTTILAQQHFYVFQERYAPFPIKLALLSRVKTRQEASEIFAGLRQGSLDMVIATHRILSNQLQLRDLGLLIIDEEHRFGVGHKEKIKQIKSNVDILTMSATPIPRTLHMALSGVRSLSLIETPPPNRFPIETKVLPFKPETVREAILEELERGGQVFYIYNRIANLDEKAIALQELVPQARIRIAHGQMDKQMLEDAMLAFYQYQYDVLLCTTIVESGLDIPTVNTLIVERVELLGLAQLHQLRGRVGRSDVQAYAYLLYQEQKTLSPEAWQRLNVLQEYSQLGSGYFIALKDLEIRGIGHIMGARQHGHIAAVGFETYCQLLEESVQSLKGEPSRPAATAAVVIDLNLSAYIPAAWIPEPVEKISVYRTLASIDNLAYLENFRRVCGHRFGPMPDTVDLLWQVTRLRILLTAMAVERVSFQGNQLVVEALLPAAQWEAFQAQHPEFSHWARTPASLSLPRVSPLNAAHLPVLEKLATAWLAI